MGIYNVKVAGVWKPAKAVHVKVSGAWQSAKEVWVKSGGVWRKAWASLHTFVINTGSPTSQSQGGSNYLYTQPFTLTISNGSGSFTYAWSFTTTSSKAYAGSGTTGATFSLQSAGDSLILGDSADSGTVTCIVTDTSTSTAVTQSVGYSIGA